MPWYNARDSSEDFCPNTPRNNFKVSVVIPYEKEAIPDGIHVIEMPDLPVDEAMGDVHKRWCHHQAVVIAAPTGARKTTYIATLIKWLAPLRQDVLVLGPRSLLRSEHKKRLTALADSKWKSVAQSKDAKDDEDGRVDLAFELTREFRDIHLTVMTMQELARQYKNMDLKRYKLVVIDEAHRSHTDALFDSSADFVLEKIPEWFRDAQRIYMTATPGAVLEDIVRVEKASSAYCPGCRSCARESCGQLLLYRFPNHFGGLSLHYFLSIGEIVSLVLSHPGERFLIFVTSREAVTDDPATSYVAALRQANIDVAYLDSSEKGSGTWTELLRNNKFSAQVLVTTKVLDVGFNILDDGLRHVVLETSDKTEFIQALGRKRRTNGETVEVYVRAASRNTLQRQLTQVNQWLDICKRGFNSTHVPDRELLIRGWNDEDENRPYAKLLIPTGFGKFKVRLTAYHALLWQQGTLKKLLRMSDTYGDDSALPRLVHEWLEDPDGYSESNWLDHDLQQSHRQVLVDYLEEHSGASLSGNDYTAFQAQLQALIAAILTEPHDNTRTLGHRALNSRLSSLSLPFAIKKEGDLHTLIHIPL